MELLEGVFPSLGRFHAYISARTTTRILDDDWDNVSGETLDDDPDSYTDSSSR